MHTLINADCLDYLNGNSQTWTTCFCDPPDNIGLGYETYKDKLPDEQYVDLLSTWLHLFVSKAKTVWFTYNAKWTFEVGRIVSRNARPDPWAGSQALRPDLHVRAAQPPRPGQQPPAAAAASAGPTHRFIPTPSACRQLAARERRQAGRPRGRVPGDVFDFTRVVGNSKQRRPWHPTQLNEGLVERCMKFTTPEGESVLDPFGGTGTTLRVCRQLG